MAPAQARPYTRDCGRAAKSFGWALLVGTAFLSALLYRHGGGPLIVILALVVAGALGAGLATWRWGLRLEDGGVHVVSWSGPGVGLFRNSWPRAALTGVRIDKEVAVTGKGTFVHYRVRVTRQGALGDLYRRRFQEGHLARAEAEVLAKLLRMDLRDETGDAPVLREAAYLDEPLVARLRRLGVAPPMPAQPANANARVRRDAAGAIVVDVPAFGFRAKLLMPVVLIYATVVFTFSPIVLADWSAGGIPWGFILMLLLVAGVPALLILVNVFDVALRRETLTVSRAGIESQVHGLGRTRRQFIPADAIEEILAPAPLPGLDDSNVDVSQVFGISHPATQVVVRTDRGDTPLGRSLPLGERRWLRDALVHALVATAGRDAGVLPADTPAPEPMGAGGRLARRALGFAVATGVVIGIMETAGLRHRSWLPGGDIADPEIDYARYELKPGPGSGTLRVYGRGVQVAGSGADVRVSIDEILLVPTRPRAKHSYRDLALSVHRPVQGGWQLVGHAETRSAETPMKAGFLAIPGPHAFVVPGIADTCVRERCHFRIHVVGRVGSERPGWEVTDMAPLALRR